ncbi:hypothetical protein Q9290_02195 [Oceanimonas sp. CHS3-5]|uniref:hypothetical protein n=1 Tax=Oceanimonas sp. CHS3-5 TaxID=3068186 RepID=UPI00273FD90B|nr:hypothetical protein [Oceanimonas sp. CHS3-5]MDP5291110.1 hypothetical protein [Oceanimonas sp. CHS3-5]
MGKIMGVPISLFENGLYWMTSFLKKIEDMPFAISKGPATEKELALIEFPLVQTCSTRSLGRRNLVGFFIFMVIMLFIAWGMFALSIPLELIILFVMLWSLLCWSTLRIALVTLKTPGCWTVTLDHRGLDWRSPDESLEPSFFLPLSSIECIGTEQTWTPGPFYPDMYTNVIKLTDGSNYYPPSRAAINTNMIQVGLQKLGKPYRITHIRPIK